MTIYKPTIILVRPQLSENIGMAARAMDNFGLKKFVNDSKVKKITEYLLAALLIITGLFVLLK